MATLLAVATLGCSAFAPGPWQQVQARESERRHVRRAQQHFDSTLPPASSQNTSSTPSHCQQDIHIHNLVNTSFVNSSNPNTDDNSTVNVLLLEENSRLELELDILAQKYTEDAMKWEQLWNEERNAHYHDQQEAELQNTRNQAEAAAVLERVIAKERAETEALRESWQSTLNAMNALLDSKDCYISDLLNERGTYRHLARSFVRLTKQRLQNTFSSLKQSIRPPRRHKAKTYHLFAHDGTDDTRRTLYSGTFCSW